MIMITIVITSDYGNSNDGNNSYKEIIIIIMISVITSTTANKR